MRFDEIRKDDERQIDELLPALARAGAAIAKSGIGRKAINNLAAMGAAGQGPTGTASGTARPQGVTRQKPNLPDTEPSPTAAPLPVATGNTPPGPPPTSTGGVQKATAPAKQMAQPNAQADPEVAKAQKAADQQVKVQKNTLQQQVKLLKMQLQATQKQLQGMK